MGSRRDVHAALLLSACLCACATSPAFEADQRLELLTPSALGAVQPPFAIQWTDDADAAGHAVFVDRPPIEPGEDLAVLADEDCRRRPGCPDDVYLAARQVYVTDGDSVMVTVLATPGGTNGASRSPVHV